MKSERIIVVYDHLGDRRRKPKKKPSVPKQYIPIKDRAIINGRIATVKNGRRIVRQYESGQPLFGRIEN